MNKKTKKGLIITLCVITSVFIILLILPFAFKGKIEKLAKDQINEMIHAQVDFDKVGLSFIRNFPNASLRIENLRVVGVADFEKDTLLASKSLEVVINLKSLFADSGYEIKRVHLNTPSLYAHILPDGKANWDIMKEDTTQVEPVDTTAMNFKLQLKDISINNARIVFQDDSSKIHAAIEKLEFALSGDLSADKSMLKTSISTPSLSLKMDGIDYISKAEIGMDARINADLHAMKFELSDNTNRINAIHFSLAGWIQMLESGLDMDLSLDANEVAFKSILSMIPAVYSNSFEGLKAGGDVSLNGHLKGLMEGENYPSFNFKLTTADGWFQYPDLPKSLQHINIDLSVLNPGGTLDATVVDLSTFSFTMGGNPFSASMRIAHPITDPEVKLRALGKIDLAMVKDIYPLGDDMNLNGLFNVDMNLNGRMSYYESNQFDKFIFSGNMSINNLLLKTTSLPQEVSIPTANLSFNNRYIDLSHFQLKIGRNDVNATGKVENFIAYALQDKTLKGNLTLQSSYLNVSDFMSDTGDTTHNDKNAPESGKKEDEALSVIEIPENINFTMQADIKQLVYEKMNFTHAKGTLKVANGVLTFENMGLNAFGGNMVLNGNYNALQPEKPVAKLDLAINQVVFNEIFSQVESLEKIVPIFSKAKGSFSTKLSLSTVLQQDMMPDLTSLIASGSLSTQSVSLTDVPVMTAIAENLKKPELASVTAKDLAVLYEIKDGRLHTKPFDVKMGDVKMNLSGSTGLDKTIAYTGKVQLPNNLNLGKFSTVALSIGGTFSKPTVKIDMKDILNNAVDEAKTQIKEEVDKIVDDAKTKVNEEIQKQKAEALKKAQEQGDKLKAEAQKAGDKLVEEARKQGDELVSKAGNPIVKKAAEVTAKKLVDEAQQKANDLNSKAENESNNIIKKVEEQFK